MNVYELITELGVYKAKKKTTPTYLDFIIRDLKMEFDINEDDWKTIEGAIIEELFKLDRCDVNQLLKYYEETIKEYGEEVKIYIPDSYILLFVNKELMKEVLTNQFNMRMVERLYPSNV